MGLTRSCMSDWGAIVKVNHQIVGKVPWRVLDEIMEEPSEYAAIASCKAQTISVRLSVTATDRRRRDGPGAGDRPGRLARTGDPARSGFRWPSSPSIRWSSLSGTSPPRCEWI